MFKLKDDQSVKMLLSNYENYKTILKDYKQELSMITNKKVTFFSNGSIGVNVSASKKFIDEFEKNENRIRSLKYRISNLKKVLRKIDLTLKTMENEENAKLLEYRYIKKMEIDKIISLLYISKARYHFYNKKLITKFRLIFNKINF